MDRDPIIITIPGEPVAKGRPRAFIRNGKIGVHTPAKTASFENLVKHEAGIAMREAGIAEPLTGPLMMQIRAIYTIPASWSKKRASEARWRTSKPDADNLAKGCADACNGIVYRDDAQVCDLRVQKCYGPRACVVVTIAELGEATP